MNANVFSSKTDVNLFRNWMDEKINLNTSIKSQYELEDAVESFTSLIHEAAFLSTPQILPRENFVMSTEIRVLRMNKRRRLRRIWQQSRNAIDKTNYNKATKYLKKRIAEIKNDGMSNFLISLDDTSNI